MKEIKDNGLSLIEVEAHKTGFLNPHIRLLALNGNIIPGQIAIEHDAPKDNFGVRHIRVTFEVYDGEE